MRIVMKKKLRLLGLVAVCVAIGACAQPEQAKAPFTPTMSVNQFMTWFLEPSADLVWDSAGFIVTEEGEVDLQPTTQEGWDNVRNHASIVAEAGNLLMQPGYAADAGDWTDYANGLVVAAQSARDAAIAKDADALFEAGGAIYRVCRACHSRYIIDAAGAPNE
jgi:hypothetical protein